MKIAIPRAAQLFLVAFLLAWSSSPARADLASKLERLVGYVIADSKTIKGWYDEDGNEKEDYSLDSYGS